MNQTSPTNEYDPDESITGKKRKRDDDGVHRLDEYDTGYFGKAEKPEDKKMKSQWLKKIIRLLRKDKDLEPHTMADFEQNLKTYSITELEEVFENLMYDIQAKSGTPFSDFLVWFFTIPFVRFGNEKFRKICHKDKGLKGDLENEVTFSFMDINPRVQIFFKFVNNFLKSIGQLECDVDGEKEDEGEGTEKKDEEKGSTGNNKGNESSDSESASSDTDEQKGQNYSERTPYSSNAARHQYPSKSI